jgi:hypothetical protein
MSYVDFTKVPGPSPWSLRKGVFLKIQQDSFSWKFDESSELSGISRLINSFGKSVLILDFSCYVQQVRDHFVLIWHEHTVDKRDAGNNSIEFYLLDLSQLEEFEDGVKSAEEFRKRKIAIGFKDRGLIAEYHTPILSPGHHAIEESPSEFADLGEILVLADFVDDERKSNFYDTMCRAIYCFDFCNRGVEVFPQDWFNNGSFDFGYQWITQVARRRDGRLCGNGIRISPFLLDDTNRNLAK